MKPRGILIEAFKLKPSNLPKLEMAALLDDGTLWAPHPHVTLHVQLLQQLEDEGVLRGGKKVLDTGWVEDGYYWSPIMYRAGANAKAREGGKLFSTGKPVSFTYLHNEAPSPKMGARFQQDIEPAGRYMTHYTGDGKLPEDPSGRVKWQTGKQSFKNPLVLWFNATGSGRYDGKSWKAKLVKAFGVQGRALSAFLRNMGFDGIVTVDLDGTTTSEIVAL